MYNADTRVLTSISFAYRSVVGDADDTVQTTLVGEEIYAKKISSATWIRVIFPLSPNQP